MGTLANILGFGQTAGPHYQLDYSTATGAGITTATQATLASSSGIANIAYLDASASMVMLRSDVDVDVIAANGYPRSEWRELATDGTTLRAFNPLTGDHTCEVLILPTHVPPIKSSFVLVQMHDNAGDIIEIALQPNNALGILEVVARINGSSRVQIGVDGLGNPIYYTWPKLITDFQWGTWCYCKIRVGAIHSGVTGYEISCNEVMVKNTDNGNMPAMITSGTNSYYKSGMYLQTKWTGSGTGGLETDRNEYGEAGWRTFKTYHNGEAAPFNPTAGTQAFDAVSNVRAGTKASGHRIASGTLSISPTLPASLTEKTMMLCIIRSSRGVNSTTTPTSAAPKPDSAPSSPTMSAAQGTWTRLISTRMPVVTGSVGAYGGGPNLQAHTIRWMLYAKMWQSGDAGPTVDIATGTTLTDTMSAVIVGVDDAKLTTIFTDLLDQLPAGLDPANPNDNNTTESGITYGAATSTTLLGPTGTVTGAAAGSLALACVYHETNVTTGGVAVVAGTDSPALTWAELCEGVITTIPGTAGTLSEDEPAWAVDYAIVPGTAGQNIAAKTAAATIAADANKPNSTTVPGKGWGVLFTVQPGKQRGRRRAT